MYLLPDIALSVRQPWAWAIVNGFKDVENRSTVALTKGGFDPRPIAIHAAIGMTRGEYEDGAEFMARLGVACPHPSDLARGAVVGGATVTAIVAASASPWFLGPRGLVLQDAFAVDPIPAIGSLGYFRWKPCKPERPIETPAWAKAWPDKPTRTGKSASPTAAETRQFSLF